MTKNAVRFEGFAFKQLHDFWSAELHLFKIH